MDRPRITNRQGNPNEATLPWLRALRNPAEQAAVSENPDALPHFPQPGDRIERRVVASTSTPLPTTPQPPPPPATGTQHRVLPMVEFDLTPTVEQDLGVPQNEIMAAEAGNVQALEHFLGANPGAARLNAPLDSVGRTLALHVAENAYKPLPALKWLAQRGANMGQADADGQTPLLLIATRGQRHEESFKWLAARPDVDPNAQTSEGLTPLYVVSRTWLDNPKPAIRALVKRNVDLNQPGPFGLRPVVAFATHSNVRGLAMQELLRAYPDQPERRVDLNARSVTPFYNIDFGTALVAIARYETSPAEALKTLQLLVGAGAHVPTALVNLDRYGFYLRPTRDHRAQGELLQDAGTFRFADGSLPPSRLEQPEGIEEHDVWSAAAQGRDDLMKMYIAFQTARVVRPEHGRGYKFPLTLAVENGQMHVVKLIVENGPRINEKLPAGSLMFDINMAPEGHAGETALWAAVRGNQQRMARFLLNNHADPTLQVRVHSKTYRNCLDESIKRGHGFLAVEFLRWGDRRVKDGKSNPFNVHNALETARLLAEPQGRRQPSADARYTYSSIRNYAKSKHLEEVNNGAD